MNIKTKLTTFITAFSIAVSSTILMPLSVSANSIASEKEFVKWNGHEKKNEEFDTWDGTFDISWLNEHTGESDDPYIIDSAEDWATLAFITGGHNIDYSNFDDIISISDIDTSTTLLDNLLIEYNGYEEEYDTNKVVYSRNYMTEEQINSVVGSGVKGCVEFDGPTISRVYFNKSPDLYFKGPDGNLYYTYFSGKDDSYIDVDFSTHIKLDRNIPYRYTLVSYKLINNDTNTEISTLTPYETSAFYGANKSKWCYNYDWCFKLTTATDFNIKLSLNGTYQTKSEYDFSKGPYVGTSDAPIIELPIDISLSKLSYYDINGNYMGKMDDSFTYIGKGATNTKMLFKEANFLKLFYETYPDEFTQLSTLASTIDASFENKVIKLGANIDFTDGIRAFKTALNGTLDLNGKVLIGPEDYAIENVANNGIIKSGVLVSSSKSLPMINYSNGLIIDCDFVRKNAFLNIHSDCETIQNIPYFIGNATEIKNINFYNWIVEGTSLVGIGNTVDNVIMTVIDGDLSDLTGYTSRFVRLVYNANEVKNVIVTADSAIINKEETLSKLYYQAIGYHATTIENCYFDDFSVYGSTSTVAMAYEANNIKDTECYTNILGESSIRGVFYPNSNMKMSNVLIDSKIEGSAEGFSLGFNYSPEIKDCIINLEVTRFRTDTSLLGKTENCYIDIKFHEDTNNSGNTLTTLIGSDFKDSFLRIMPIDENCNDYISVGSGAGINGNVEHSYLYLQNINLTGTEPLSWGKHINNSYFKLKTSATGYYGLALSGKNNYIDIEFDGGSTPLIQCEYGSVDYVLENCYIHVNLKGNFTHKHFYDNVARGVIKDSIYMLTIDDNASGSIATGIQKTYIMDNSFIFIDEFPDACYTDEAVLLPFSNNVGHYTNSTIIMPKINWKNYNNNPFTICACQSSMYNTDFHDISAYINVFPYDNNSENIPPYATMVSGGLHNLISNIAMEVNFFDVDGSSADIPVRLATCLATPSGGFDGVAFKTNVKDAAIFNGSNIVYGAYLLGNATPNYKMSNIYLDVPNGQIRNDIKSGLMASFPGSSKTSFGASLGSFNKTEYYENADISTLGYHVLNNMGYNISNVLIPNGQSPYYQRYLDDSNKIDSENIPAYIDQFYYNSDIAPIPGNAGDWDYSIDLDWVTRVTNRQLTTAEIAYILDCGASENRTTNWTVLDDITFCNPNTGEILFTLPKHLDLTTTPYYETKTPFSDITKIPTENTFSPISTFNLNETENTLYNKFISNVDSISGELEQYPIYKYTIVNGNNGEVPATAFTKNTITDGILYAKSNVVLLGNVTVDNGYELISVTEDDVIIPSTDENIYSVAGYKAPAKDATIKTTFLNIIAEITKFEIPNPKDTSNPYIGTIDQTTGDIIITVPHDYNINNVTPIITWQGKTLTPDENVAQDFSIDIEYTVVAEAGNSKTYKVCITVLPPPDDTAIITSFKVDKYNATIEQKANDENGIITLKVPENFDGSNVIPEIIWKGETLIPNEHTSQNLANSIIYTVKAESGREKQYNIIVDYIPIEKPPIIDDPIINNPPILDNTAIITKFKVNEYIAIIEQNHYDEHGLITLTVPEGFNLTNVLPDITWRGESLTPNEYERQNLTNNIVYTVTAESNRVKKYDVIIKYTNEILPDDTAIITNFKVNNYIADIEQNQLNETGRIILTVSSLDDLSSVIPNISWKGKTLNPAENTVQDLTNNLTYTVTAESGRIKKYDVVIYYISEPPIIAEDEAIITKFNINEYSGKITQNDINELGIIEISIPENVDISNITPNITWKGVKLNPADNEAQDFTQDNIIYTVTAESGRTKSYEVHITIIPNSNPDTGIESPWNVLRWSFIIILSGGVICFINKRKKEFWN